VIALLPTFGPARRRWLGAALLASLVPLAAACEKPPARAPDLPAEVTAIRDLDYAGTGNPHQTLDLYTPSAPRPAPLPLVVFIHGGGWEGADKNELVGMLMPLVASGDFAGASINYRLTDEGPHPLQIHDAKAAIRWLRARAGSHGIDPERIGVLGVSAGGHLASLVGTSGGIAELEGDVGGNADRSSRVSCVGSLFAPSNFLSFGDQKSLVDPYDPASIIGKLLGGGLRERADVAKSASPVTWIGAGDPPFLHVHGAADDVVPVAQARGFDAALDAAGIPSTLLVAEKGGHLFFSEEVKGRLREFFAGCLLGAKTDLHDGAVAAW
jgi:acetyl esterase/lipase